MQVRETKVRHRAPLFGAVFFVAIFLGGCIHPMVKFHKAKLLDPMMDPAKTEGFHSAFRAEPMKWNERGSGDVGGAVGGSCPTCGG